MNFAVVSWDGQTSPGSRVVCAANPIAEMATLFGGLNEPGGYVVLVKWYAGYTSAPHSYATDLLCLVLSGTRSVNSGTDFDPNTTVPAPAGGFVRRVAHTAALRRRQERGSGTGCDRNFGAGPVDLKLVDLSKPAWRYA
jgi:hypothetical protein